MAIITKPVEGILKGVPAIFTLNKSQVLALPLVSGDDYFSNSDNWERIILKYKSSEGKQQELVAFDTSLESPTGFFLISEKARGLFEIQSLKIVDFDGDVFVVPRSALNVADFDIVLLTAPSSLSYSTPVMYTENTAITNNVPAVTGTVTSYSILPALPAGLSLNTTTGVISGTPTEASAAANYVVTASNGAGSTTATINITVESEIIDEFWDVANKSGVGTVSVGANRLITKTSGGGAYDVNVLSLETITGDGYIEFPNSSLLNINNFGVSVIGLAEQTSTSGGFQNIILGAFTTNNNWERVVNGSTAGFISATNPNDIVRIGRIGTEYYIKINDVIKTQVTINNTNPLKASISLFTTGTGVDNITVESAEVLVGDPIIWDTFLNGSTPQADGGISGGTSGAIVKSNVSKAENGADFKFTFNFTRGPVNDSFDYLWGIMPSIDNTGFAGWTGVTLQSSNSILIYDNYSGSGPHSTTFSNSMLVLGPNTSEFEKIGNVLTIKMNGVIIYTKNNYTEQISVPMVRLWQGEQVLDSAYAEIQQTMAVDPILWQSKPGYIIEADGGATATSERPSYGEFYRVLAPSSQWVTGDFTFEAEINNAYSHNDFIGFYDSDTNFSITTGFSGSVIWYEQSTPTSYVKPTGDTYTVKMQRIGYVIKFYVNDVEVYSATQTNLSTVKVPFFTFTNSTKYIVSATLILPEVDPDILTFTGRNSATYISFPAPGSVTRLLPAVNLAGNGQGSFWSTTPLTEDFTFTATVKAGSVSDGVVQALFGLNDVMPPPSNSGYGLKAAGWGLNFYDAGSVVRPWDVGVDTLAYTKGSTYNIEIKRVSGVVSYKVNSTTFSYTLSTSATVYLVGYLQVGSWEVTNAQLVTPTSDYITWDLLSGHPEGSLTITPTSGVSGGSSSNGIAVKSDADKSTGDFDYTFKFDWSAATSVVDMFAGVAGNNETSGYFWDRLTCIYGNGNNPDTAYFWHDGSAIGTQYNQTLLNGVNTYRLTRVGTTITHYLNDVQIYSAISNSFTAYPSVRTMGNSVVTESYITEAPISVTWNVAGKTGVGTVTTGANGLITKSTGGNGYNVNVLSNETITGDGYVEFINSSIFLNVVFGLAEVNSSSGSYDQIIYGTYVAGLGAYERVLAGQASGGGIGASANGDVIRIQRTGTTFSIFKNGSVINTVTINNTNPLKASVSIYPGTSYGVNNVTLPE